MCEAQVMGAVDAVELDPLVVSERAHNGVGVKEPVVFAEALEYVFKCLHSLFGGMIAARFEKRGGKNAACRNLARLEKGFALFVLLGCGRGRRFFGSAHREAHCLAEMAQNLG